MPCFVTGIAPTSDISDLEKALGAVPSMDHAKLAVITREARSEEHDDSFINFIHAAGDATIMTGGGGTNVPGINRDPSALGYLGHDQVVSRLGVLPIPDDEVGNYNDALEEGRCIVAYDCAAGDSAAIEAAFRAAGVHRVKTYQGA